MSGFCCWEWVRWLVLSCVAVGVVFLVGCLVFGGSALVSCFAFLGFKCD